MPDLIDADICTCDNCGWRGPFAEVTTLFQTSDLAERLTPGEIVPAGECPECDCFCYPVKPGDMEKERNAWRGALQRLTPMGSEFTAPQDCEAFARRMRDEGVHAKLDRARLSIEVSTLCAVLTTAAELMEKAGLPETGATMREAVGRAKDQCLARTDREPLTAAELLNLALASGLAFGDAVNAFAAVQRTQEPRLTPYIEAARQLREREGELEFDDPGVYVSESEDGGAYVMGWVWITDSDAGVTRDEGEG